MLTIRAEIRRKEQKSDGTFNVKLRFTLKRQVKRLSTSLFVKSTDLFRTGGFKKGTPIYKEIEKLVEYYQNKCAEMQVDINNYSLDEIIARLKFDEMKKQEIDFIAFARKWIKNATIKSTEDYNTFLNSLLSFIKKDTLNVSEIKISFLNKYAEYLAKRRAERVKKLIAAGKRVPSNRMASSYLGAFRHLFKEAQRQYNDYDNNLFLIPHSPFDNFKIPRQEATRKRAISRETIKKIYELPYKNEPRGAKKICRHDIAKDAFIISFCLMGMNSVDLFNATQIVDNRIVYNRTKTESRRLDRARMEVDIPEFLLPLMEKYRDKSGKRIFKFYKYYADRKAFNRAINLGLKEIGEQVGVNDLEFYAARHSWATIAVNKVGIDKYTVHAALNHIDESMKVTDIYIERDFVNENKANSKVIKYVFG